MRPYRSPPHHQHTPRAVARLQRDSPAYVPLVPIRPTRRQRPGLARERRPPQGPLPILDHSPQNKTKLGAGRRRHKRTKHPDVRISADGENYYIFTKDKILHATLDELGEIIEGDPCLYNLCDLDLDLFPPAVRWGNGFKGLAAAQFPHPEAYSLPTLYLLSTRLPNTPRSTHRAPSHPYAQRAQTQAPQRQSGVAKTTKNKR